MNYKNLSVEKDMYYNTAKSFSEVLEELDPSYNYEGTVLKGLDAFQRQLSRFNINVTGNKSGTISEFFQNKDTSALFPEYVRRAVKLGLDEYNKLPYLVATTTKINGLDYRSISATAVDNDATVAPIAEGTALPELTVKTQDKLVTMKKRGQLLNMSYETFKFHRIDLFTVLLKQMGAYIAQQQLKDACDVLINGDGNSNPAGVINSATAGQLTYNDLLELWESLGNYNLNTIIASPDTAIQLLNIPEFKHPMAGLDFQSSGKMITPLGATLLKTKTVASDSLIGIDRNCALEQVVAGDIVVDVDKLIDKQLDRASVTSICGFAKICPDAAKVLST